MSVSTNSDLYYDPYDVDIYADPYPVFKRLRDEAPLYRNDEYGFYALSRFDDVKAAFGDPQTYSSAKGTMLETITSDFTPPSGFFINEDPPLHGGHRERARPRLHATARHPARAPDPGLHRAVARRPRRPRRVRLRRRPLIDPAHARHQHAARHPRGGSGRHPPARRRAAAT